MANNAYDRRDFLRGAALTSLGVGMSVIELTPPAEASQAARPVQAAAPPLSVAVIGLGNRGREILSNLAKMGPTVNVVTLCDTFTAPAFIKRSQDIAPKAGVEADYRKVLDNKAVQAVFIATPTHKHKQITLDALAAGKHVYLEAPLAVDLSEAREIASAGAAAKTIFMPGLQARCNNQAEHVKNFVFSGALGRMASVRAQHHERTKWRAAWPSPEREAELNWRLRKETSNGILGEIAIHQIDTVSRYMRRLPTAVTAFGGIMEYRDGRTVHDTAQAIFEYPNGIRFVYDITLTGSFDGAYELFCGSACTIMLRDQRAWMFKEADAPLLGWEVFARKDPMQIGDPKLGSGLLVSSGIALVADATKQLALGKEPGKLGQDVSKSALWQACKVFLDSVRAGKPVPVKEPSNDFPNPSPPPTALIGYQATVVAAKANEAAMKGGRVEITPDMVAL